MFSGRIQLRPHKNLMEYTLFFGRKNLGKNLGALRKVTEIETITVKICRACKNLYPENYASCEGCGSPLQLYEDYINNRFFSSDQESATSHAVAVDGSERSGPDKESVSKIKNNFILAISELNKDIDDFCERLKKREGHI